MKKEKSGAAKSIGIDVPAPKERCENDQNCPFHGSLSLRGRVFAGTVQKAKMLKYATVEWSRQRLVKKYERYENRRSRVAAHNPHCIKAAAGDRVLIMECRKLSKTKNFVIIQKLEDNSARKEEKR